MKNLVFLIIPILGIISCSDKVNTDQNKNLKTVNKVEAAHFTTANATTKISTVACTLSDGTESKCFQITTTSTPTDHQMGPWCPTKISDDASAGGIWLEGGKVYDVDGAFIKNLATFYKDDTWKMYDDNGNVIVTKTKEDCVNAANPNVGEEYKNFCVECLPSYLTNISSTYLIPITPVIQNSPTEYRSGGGGPRPDRPGGPNGKPNRPPRGQDGKPDRPPKGQGGPGGGGPRGSKGGIPATRGVALNGVEFSAPAPVNNILGAYTLAPFDDAGGHINVHQGYHYHAATGVSFSVKQSDGHAPLIGYAMDGHGIYSLLDETGNEPMGLDDCRGHYDDIRGYHYHVDGAGKNNFINCLHGAYAKE